MIAHDDGVGELTDQEFKIYDHHLRLINGKSNKGWLGNLYDGITKQIMRQELAYWMLYIAARPDGSHQLVSAFSQRNAKAPQAIIQGLNSGIDRVLIIERFRAVKADCCGLQAVCPAHIQWRRDQRLV